MKTVLIGSGSGAIYALSAILPLLLLMVRTKLVQCWNVIIMMIPTNGYICNNPWGEATTTKNLIYRSLACVNIKYRIISVQHNLWENISLLRRD
jgi:hypothetical protein